MTFDLLLYLQCVAGLYRGSSERLHSASGSVRQQGAGQRPGRGAGQHRDQVRLGALAEEPGDPWPLTSDPSHPAGSIRKYCTGSEKCDFYNVESHLYFLIKHPWNRDDSLTNSWGFRPARGSVDNLPPDMKWNQSLATWRNLRVPVKNILMVGI